MSYNNSEKVPATSPGVPATSPGVPATFLKRLLMVLSLLAGGCEMVQPEVVVINRLGEPVQIRDVSFKGCHWAAVLEPGQASPPCACQPGRGRVRFKLFDVQWFVNEVVDAAERDILELDPVDDHIGWKLPTPIWHAYRTAEQQTVDYGGFYQLDLTAAAIEQDFEAPVSVGH